MNFLLVLFAAALLVLSGEAWRRREQITLLMKKILTFKRVIISLNIVLFIFGVLVEDAGGHSLFGAVLMMPAITSLMLLSWGLARSVTPSK